MNIKKIVFIALFLGIGLLSYRWYFNCMKDHRNTLKEIGIPMQENILAFYKERQRYPNLEESTELMEKAGCMNTRQVRYGESKSERGEIYERWVSFNCGYGFLKIGYSFSASIGDVNAKTYQNPYGIHSSKGNTRCSASFDKSGELLGKFTCYQDTCFNRLSH